MFIYNTEIKKKTCNKFLTAESLELKAKYLHEIFKTIESLYRYDIWEISQWYFQWPLFHISNFSPFVCQVILCVSFYDSDCVPKFRHVDLD